MAEQAPLQTIDGTFYVPNGAPRPEYVPPDDVILQTTQHYDLLIPNVRGIDPLVGTGTIPRVINSAGGDCLGIELDSEHHAIAQRETPPGSIIILGDCTQVYMPEYEAGLHYIYTSPPFDLLLNHPEVMDEIAFAFSWMLRPGGMLIIDSADEAIRGGRNVRPAGATIAFFAQYGFRLHSSLRFWATNAPDGTDSQFTELMFARPW